MWRRDLNPAFNLTLKCSVLMLSLCLLVSLSLSLLPPQPSTLRGSILEDSVPSSSKHGGPRGLPLKEVLDYVLPELSTSCLRVASSAPAVPELLLQLDQQWVSTLTLILLLLLYY